MSHTGHDPSAAAEHGRNLPMELALAFDVTSCRTCSFFWPGEGKPQPYGPYASYDFTTDMPAENPRSGQPWITGRTVEPNFPTPEIMDGCRKAPIMTIGINPNLTAFAPGRLGTSWCYPRFTSDHKTNAFTKNAYYYRYRSIYQEHLAFDFAKRFALPDGKIVARADGALVSAVRTDDSPAYAIVVRYAGEAANTTIHLAGKAGEAPYMLFVDVAPPHNAFKRGDLLAAKVAVPAGEKAEIFAQQISYYTRFLAPLQSLEATIKKSGHAGAALRIGEDVGQLDMVACASPHWGPPWLGGSKAEVATIMHNCVSQNAWALKQLLHSQPALLVLVGQASYDMFAYAFGHLIERKPPLAKKPEDGAYTLLRETCDPARPALFRFATKVDGKAYSLSTRIVVAPHFSYVQNYFPQFRLAAPAWARFVKQFADCDAFLKTHHQVVIVPPAQDGEFVGVQLTADAEQIRAQIARRWPDAARALEPAFYDPNAMLAKLLSEMYAGGALGWVDGKHGERGYLRRTDGPCTFCDNHLWKFPLGCPYGKPQEAQYPAGFLTAVAQQLIDSSTHWRAQNRSIAEKAVTGTAFRGFPDPTV